jgi:hypothetical protein
LEVIVEGLNGYAVVDESRLINRRASLTDIRAQPCCLPEGLYHIKDNKDDWLYYASAANAQVRRIHLRTRAIQVVQSSSLSDNSPSTFRKIAVSDGTFGPPVALPLSGGDLAGEVFTDLDLDGDLDIVWNSYSPDIWGWCLNDGSGGFSGCGQQQGLDLPNMFEVADVNGDNYDDIIVSARSGREPIVTALCGRVASSALTSPARQVRLRIRLRMVW